MDEASMFIGFILFDGSLSIPQRGSTPADTAPA
jgi:hypothetical protein